MPTMEDDCPYKFPDLEPIMMDTEMEPPDDERCVNLRMLERSANLDTTNTDFEDFFLRSPRDTRESDPMNCFPDNLSKTTSPTLTQPGSSQSNSRSVSPEDSNNESMSDSAPVHMRNNSATSDFSTVFSTKSLDKSHFHTARWLGPSDVRRSERCENLFPGRPEFLSKEDIERSNKVMDSTFDFDSAASSPSPRTMFGDYEPIKAESEQTKTLSTSSATSTQPPVNHVSPASYQTSWRDAFYRLINPHSTNGVPDGRHSNMPGSFSGTRPNVPPSVHPALSPSPDSRPYPPPPLDAHRYAHGVYDIGAIYAHAMRYGPYVRPKLTIQRTSLKSRVETQIPITMVMEPLPPGVKKLRLPSYTLTKPKHYAPADTPPSPDVYELSVSVVCTSAMQDKELLERAFKRARGETLQPKPLKEGVSEEDRPDENDPLNGGEVKICVNCMNRERKRASRKKQKKQEEEEQFLKEEEKRVLVFNTSEIKEWEDLPRVNGATDPETPYQLGAMQVNLPMRIACYCRHQNEKIGFQVIFTVKDYLGNVVAQDITNSIMITDDHKTHAPSSQTLEHQGLNNKAFPPPRPAVDMEKQVLHQLPFNMSSSTTDLQGLQENRYEADRWTTNPNAPLPVTIPISTPVYASAPVSRGLSRQASVSTEFSAPLAKRRKQHTPGRLPGSLTMTKTSNARHRSSKSTTPGVSSQVVSPRAVEQPFVMPSSMNSQTVNAPLSPISNDATFLGPREGHRNLDGMTLSTPNSAHPSRPSSPGHSVRTARREIDAQPPQTWTNSQVLQPFSNQTRPFIHKVVPAEGSVHGGDEVTVLGNNFVPGMEVVFGDTVATVTTFWGEKCLSCLSPPALQAGTVNVVLKHDHPRLGQNQQQSMLHQILFRYTDDRELQMYRLAFGVLGQKLGSSTDVNQIMQHIVGGNINFTWNGASDHQGGRGRGAGNSGAKPTEAELDAGMVGFLEFMDLADSPGLPNFDMRTTGGQTLLHFACSLGLIRFVTGLLIRRVNTDSKDRNGNTPMHLAAMNGHENVVRRLKLYGADTAVQNLRGFTPADIASSFELHQAVISHSRHNMSRGRTPPVSRRMSSVSLDQFWETSSSAESNGLVYDDTSDDGDDNGIDDQVGIPLYKTTSLRQAAVSQAQPGYHAVAPGGAIPQNLAVVPPVQVEPLVAEHNKVASLQASLIAWRENLATHISQFQEALSTLPAQMPAIPQLPALPDYQAYPVIQRISSLVPNRPTTSWSSNIMKDSWDRLTGNLSPPSYEELYPGKKDDDDHELKKNSLVEAALDAAADQHFEQHMRPSSSASTTSSSDDTGDVRIGTKSTSPRQQEKLRKAHALKMKRIESDRKLFFIWIPLLIIIMFAMLQNIFPGFWQGVWRGFKYMRGHSNTVPHREAIAL